MGIYIRGEDKKSFYYDLNKNYFINWGDTNEIHLKPALIFYLSELKKI